MPPAASIASRFTPSRLRAQTSTVAPVWSVSPGSTSYYINSVAVCADGSRTIAGTFLHTYGTAGRQPANGALAPSASDTGTFGTYCYNAAGQLQWKDEFNGWQGVYWVAISTSGAYAASGGWFSGSPNYAGFVRAYDASTGKMLLNYATPSRVNQVVLSADGTWLLAATTTLLLFKLVNGAYQRTGQFDPGGTNNTVITADMSASGQQIVCGDLNGSLYAIANSSGQPTLQKAWPLPQKGYSHSVRITPSGSSFAAGGASGYFYLFDVGDFLVAGKPAMTQQVAGGGSVYGVAIADDASAFVGISNLTPGSNVGGLVSYVIRRGGLAGVLWKFQTDRNPNCASLNQANGMVAIADGHPDGSPGDFYLLDASTGALRWKYTTGNMSWPIQIAANGSAIVGGSDDSQVYYFTPQGGAGAKLNGKTVRRRRAKAKVRKPKASAYGWARRERRAAG
ncbi:MAG TPA: WD40 repeat domain-containing protein [Opitutus sp.]|nr:WD40 repeat domain-containing protein [Opitutus sp.]